MKYEIAISITFVLIIFTILSPSFIHLNQVFAAGKFSIDVKINLKNITHNDKLKVVASTNGENETKYASTNGENETKYLTGNDLDSNTATVSFEFNQKNDIVTVCSRDEYFVCAYALNPITDQMKSYSCVEGNIEHPDGKKYNKSGHREHKDLIHRIVQDCRWWSNRQSNH